MNDLISRSALQEDIKKETDNIYFFPKRNGKQRRSDLLAAIDFVAQRIKHQPAIEAEHEWINVEDRLPDKFKDANGVLINYLCYMPDYGVDVANYIQPVDEWVCMGIPAKVTHWMPLPEPPKEE